MAPASGPRRLPSHSASSPAWRVGSPSSSMRLDGARHQPVVPHQQGGEGAVTSLLAVGQGQVQGLLQPLPDGWGREGG